MNKNNNSLLSISNEWLEFHSSTIKFSSMNMYKLNIKRICTYFSSINIFNIQDITIFEAQKFINYLYTNGLAKSTIQKAKITLGLIIGYAYKNNLITTDISKYIKLPKNAPVTKRSILNDDQIKIICNNINNINDLYLLVLLILGLRKSEAAALEWENINIEKNIIIINKIVNWHGNKAVLYYKLKNNDEERILPIPQLLKDVFIKFYKPTGFIFNNNGMLLTSSQIDNFWKKCLEGKNLSNITQHMLRHTYATILYKSNVDLKTAQYLMGHRDTTMILKIYTHLDKNFTNYNICKFNDFLNETFL